MKFTKTPKSNKERTRLMLQVGEWVETLTQKGHNRVRDQRSTFYEVRPRKDKRGADLISNVLPFGRLWYTEASDAVEYTKFYSRSDDAVIRVYDESGERDRNARATGRFQGVVTISFCRAAPLSLIKSREITE